VESNPPASNIVVDSSLLFSLTQHFYEQFSFDPEEEHKKAQPLPSKRFVLIKTCKRTAEGEKLFCSPCSTM
jgi:hypothetical protein